MIIVYFEYLVFLRKAILGEEEVTGVLGSFVLPHKVFPPLVFGSGQVRGEGLVCFSSQIVTWDRGSPFPYFFRLVTIYIDLYVYCLLSSGK